MLIVTGAKMYEYVHIRWIQVTGGTPGEGEGKSGANALLEKNFGLFERVIKYNYPANINGGKKLHVRF